MKIDTSGKTAYFCATQQQADEFLEECKKQGIEWKDFITAYSYALFCPIASVVKLCFVIESGKINIKLRADIADDVKIVKYEKPLDNA